MQCTSLEVHTWLSSFDRVAKSSGRSAPSCATGSVIDKSAMVATGAYRTCVGERCRPYAEAMSSKTMPGLQACRLADIRAT